MKNRYLTLESRREIEALYLSGMELASIADSLNVHLATIYRELARGYTGEIDKNGRRGYNAAAHEIFLQSLKRRGHKDTSSADSL